MTEHSDFEPGWVSHPGETIADILEERELNPAVFAQRIGQTPDYAKALLDGRAEITAAVAKQLAEVLGGSQSFWVNRETQYRRDVKRLRGGLDLVATKQFIDNLPVNDMIAFGWIEPAQSVADRAGACLQFFGVPDADAWHQSYADVLQTVFRTSPTFESDPAAVAAWLRRGELEAASIECAPWNPEKFNALLSGIRALTREKNPAVFVPELRKRCAAAGVAIVVARAPKKCRASGAVRILPRGRRLILLSFRYLSDDHFWFTFFHEAGHLLLHDTEALLLEDIGAISDKMENEANAFAADILVPPEYRSAMLALPVDGRVVMRFAKDIGVSPGVVVGQMQYYRRLKPQQLNRLKKRFQWQAPESQT